MNQLAEENIQKTKWNQKSPASKNKTKKLNDTTAVKDANIKVSQEKICEALANTLHINSVSDNNLTNGTSDHVKADCSNESHQQPSAQESHPAAAVPQDVNSVHCKEAGDTARDIYPQTSIHHLEHSNLEQQNIKDEIEIVSYESELQMPEIMRIIQKDLSEPYSIYTYRYFIHNWPKLCFLATIEGKCIGAIVCKLDIHRDVVKRGYIAMLAVDEKYRKRRIGSRLVRKAIQVMIDDNADEVVLETEITNKSALKLYENLGFVRDKRLFRYYLNGVDALRLKLWLR